MNPFFFPSFEYEILRWPFGLLYDFNHKLLYTSSGDYGGKNVIYNRQNFFEILGKKSAHQKSTYQENMKQHMFMLLSSPTHEHTEY